jgi:formylglycine-generating enzyme required for sulfatase activity
VGAATDDINISASIDSESDRVYRGGAFTNRPALARAPDRNWLALSIRNFDIGFRIGRTYP